MILKLQLVFLALFNVASCGSVNKAFMYEDGNGNLYMTSEASKDNRWIAQAVFDEKLREEGFTYLSVKSSPNFDNKLQSYAAGYLEGYLTRVQFNQSCFNQNIGQQPTGPIRQFVEDNYRYIQTQVESNQDEPFWYQAMLLLYQIKGMEDGYYEKCAQMSRDIDPMEIMWIYNWRLTELTDLEMKYAYEEHWVLGSASCSALIKNLGHDLVFTHVTWSEYSTMLRTMKRYEMPLTMTQSDTHYVPGTAITESSYPGIIHSVDDFYITNQQLVVMETTNEIQNRTLYEFIQPNSVPYFLRISIANRLSVTAPQWVSHFSTENSGTYNNQWMAVDYKLFTPNQPIEKDTLWVAEQMPGFVVSKDMSHVLNENQRAWVSYNVPAFPETQQMNNYSAYIDAYGPFFSHDHCPRANIFRRDVPKAVDVNSTIYLMRYNDYQHDEYAKCNCTPMGYSAENGISARCELNPMNGSYAIAAEGARCHGATDLKITNFDMVKRMQLFAISGPTYEQQPVFDWSEQVGTACEHKKHEGMPDRFQFDPVLLDMKY